MDSESDVRLKIRKRVEEFYINLRNPLSSIYLLVGGILEKHTGSLSKRIVRHILKELKFTDSEIQKAENFLTSKGWIIPGKRKWLTLSEPSWEYKERFKKGIKEEEWEEIVKYPRKQLDVLITAMPRACIIQLYRALNYPQIVCLQNWYYNKARKYVYDKTGYVTEVEVLERGSKKEQMVCFGENVFTRFEHEMFYDLVGESFLTLMGRADYDVHSRSNNIMEIEIDQRTQKMVDKCWRGNIQLVGRIYPFDVNYNSVWSVFQILNYYHPDTIWVSGNRVTALGMAMYWVECSKSGRKINLYAPHVEAESYSEDIIPDLNLILSVTFNGFSTSVRNVA